MTSPLARPGFYPATGPLLAPALAAPDGSPIPRPAGASRGRERVVGMADFAVSSTPEDRLVTYALGSCLGIAVWDSVALVGGLLHVMLPSASAAEPERSIANPWMFIDTGVPLLFKECYKLGAKKSRMVIKLAGGSHTGLPDADDHFQIGKRNLVAMRALLRTNGVAVQGEDVGGMQLSRTISLDIGTGAVALKVSSPERYL